MITPKTPPGFNELLPKDQLVFNKMLAQIQKSYEGSGFTPLETSALELAPVLLAKEGGETSKQVYRFTKGDTDYALRFDLTVPLARYVAEHYHDLPMPFRRYQIQEVWRAEKPQAGRFRQFYQCDVDIIGSNSVAAEAEVIIAAANAYKSLGLKKTIFKISHRGLIAGFLADRTLDRLTTEVLRTIDKMDKLSTSQVNEELKKIGLSSNNTKEILSLVTIHGNSKEITKKLNQLLVTHNTFNQALENLAKLEILLHAGGMKSSEFIFDLKIARGFDYYTGVVFEMFLPNSNSSVGSGGRYDNLVSNYSKENLAGVGASIGVSRLFSVLKEKNNGPSTPTQALIVVFSENLLPYCFKVAAELRTHNLNIEVYPGAAKMAKQLNYANKLGIPFVLLCGEDEEKKNQVTIKDMKSGKQQIVSLTTENKKIISSLS
jgi:histidyl-tRNA synthetase